MILAGLFGNDTAAKVLLYLENFETGYPRAVSQTYSISISQVQRQLEKLELEGVLSSRLVGRTRVYSFNPRCFYLDELRGILKKSLESLPASEQEKYFRQRKRPRRTGKVLPK